MTDAASLHRWDQLPLEKVTAGITLLQTYLKKGAIVPLHVHRGAIAIYVLQGELAARVGDLSMAVREGDVLLVPGGVPHQAESVDDTFVITFSPAD
jgi:quercetin dioxygenase-like cupin family protein